MTTLESIGFVHTYNGGPGTRLYRKVVGAEEVWVTVGPSGRTYFGRPDGRTADHPTTESAVAELASLYGSTNDDPDGGTLAAAPGLAEVSWDEFQARRAGE